MLRIRLSRVGKKGHPAYRIVVAEARSPRDGAYLEWIGTYDPMQNPPEITLKHDRAQHWLSVGAQATEPVQRILDKLGASEAVAVAVAEEEQAVEEELAEESEA